MTSIYASYMVYIYVYIEMQGKRIILIIGELANVYASLCCWDVYIYMLSPTICVLYFFN